LHLAAVRVGIVRQACQPRLTPNWPNVPVSGRGAFGSPSNPACPSLGKSSRNHLSKSSSRSLSTHGLHMLPHWDTCHHHFLDLILRLPRLPPPPANYSSLEVMHRTLHTTTYMCSQRGISPQLFCRLVERPPAHVGHMVPRSPALSFWFGAGGRISVARMCRVVMIHFVFSTSVCRIF